MEFIHSKVVECVRRGSIWYVDLGVNKGSVQGGKRPCVVIQNDIGNKFSPTVIVAMITSKINKKKLPTHVMLLDEELPMKSMVLLEQIKTVNKTELLNYVGCISERDLNNIDEAIEISLGIDVKIHKPNYEAIRLSSKIETYDELIKYAKESGQDVSFISQQRAVLIGTFMRFCISNNIDINDYYSEIG